MADIQILRRIPLFSSLGPEKLLKLSEISKEATFAKNSVIFLEKDDGDALYIINNGKVRVTKVGSDGRELILAVLADGDFFGDMSLVDGESRSATLVAMDDTYVSYISRSDFLKLLEANPAMAIDLLSEFSKRLRETNMKLSDLVLLDVYGRLARTLLEFLDNDSYMLDDGRLAFIRPTHQAIASMIGTTRETVTRTLKDLEKKGIIELKGKEIIISPHFEEDISEYLPG